MRKLSRYQLLELLIMQTERADALEKQVAELRDPDYYDASGDDMPGLAMYKTGDTTPIMFYVVAMCIFGMVEIPEFGVKLPLYSTWDTGKLTSFPCRFYGSAYVGSLIIGGNDQSGQFDCLQKMDLGTAVKIVDMQGAEFSYSATRIDRSKSADLDILWDAEYDLTMFARYANSKEYVIVRLQAQ